MENMGEWEQRSLINELTQGRELARQLQVYLNVPSSSHETRELLVQKIQASFEKALSMLNCNTSLAVDQPQPSGLAIRMSESPPSRSASPRSEDSDRDFKEQELKFDASKKRKTLPRWTQQVRVTPGTALEGPLDDGFSWRKYGQKDILGAKYPRGYYRCTHRNVQGCLATKQVQRSDDDPTIFDITYRGRHTCNLASHVMPPSVLSENQEQGTSIDPQQHNQQEEQTQKQSQDLLLSFRRGLKVITQDLHIREQTYPSFPNYPSSTRSNIKVENNVVFSPSVMNNNNVVGNLSPSLISPATSGSNYCSVSPSPSGMSSTHMQGNVNFPTFVPQPAEIIQASTSATNLPTVGLDFPFGNAEFDPNFTFDNHGFFS
ncbi:probable WRKY transcription factor 53 [Durio zibethinus]|uniref:Probable WRKY transcription factor 53 n=1 Tax=Durio zibethinus TaxID=66656 RepID=A0A6P5YEF3_DURZI|nr:probable WRKY transcription factor 53 [Durio zibethinus]